MSQAGGPVAAVTDLEGLEAIDVSDFSAPALEVPVDKGLVVKEIEIGEIRSTRRGREMADSQESGIVAFPGQTGGEAYGQDGDCSKLHDFWRCDCVLAVVPTVV